MIVGPTLGRNSGVAPTERVACARRMSTSATLWGGLWCYRIVNELTTRDTSPGRRGSVSTKRGLSQPSCFSGCNTNRYRSSSTPRGEQYYGRCQGMALGKLRCSGRLERSRWRRDEVTRPRMHHRRGVGRSPVKGGSIGISLLVRSKPG